MSKRTPDGLPNHEHGPRDGSFLKPRVNAEMSDVERDSYDTWREVIESPEVQNGRRLLVHFGTRKTNFDAAVLTPRMMRWTEAEGIRDEVLKKVRPEGAVLFVAGTDALEISRDEFERCIPAKLLERELAKADAEQHAGRAAVGLFPAILEAVETERVAAGTAEARDSLAA